MTATVPVRRRGRWLDRALSILLVSAALVPVIAISGALAGFRMMIIKTGSMTPALQPGDLVVTRYEPITGIRPRDVVTYFHPGLHAHVTHRVVKVHARSGLVEVTTKGDANSAAETWRMRSSGRVAKEVFRIPGMSPGTEATVLRVLVLVVVAAGVMYIGWLLRKIWRAPDVRPQRVSRTTSAADLSLRSP